MDTETDENIVGRIQSGDHDLFGLLIDRYELKLERYARRFLSSDEDIQDQIQEVFIKTYTNIQSFDTNKRFSPWIYRIAHNTFVNELRRKQNSGRSFLDIDTILPYLVSSDTSDGDVLQKELAEELEHSLDEVPGKYREPLILFYYEQLSYQEIAEVLHIPVMTVGVRLKRGREQLKKLYEANKK